MLGQQAPFCSTGATGQDPGGCCGALCIAVSCFCLLATASTNCALHERSAVPHSHVTSLLRSFMSCRDQTAQYPTPEDVIGQMALAKGGSSREIEDRTVAWLQVLRHRVGPNT